MNIRAIIIEDEEPARDLLKNYLKDFPNIEILGEFPDGFSGLKAINELKPQLVLLDIQMPKLTGFEILELIDHKPEIIFITAFNQYAIQAFEANALDYLLKPVSRNRFAVAIKKAEEKIKSENTKNPSDKKPVQLKEISPEIIDRIAVKNNSKIEIVACEEIIYLEAEGDYVLIYTAEKKLIKEKTMKYFEEHLPSTSFVRIHRSYIINISFLSRIEHFEKENYLVILKNGQKLKASLNGVKKLKELLKL